MALLTAVEHQLLELREHTTSGPLALEPWEADALRSTVRDLTVAPTNGMPGHYDVRPGSTIGVVDLGRLAVEIRPKIPIDRVLFLLSYRLDPGAWRSSTTSFASADSIVEAIVPAFVAQVRAATARGLLHGYRSEDDALPGIRGRIRFGDQIRTRFGDRLPVEVTYDEFTPDIEVNRILRAAIDRLRRLRLRNDRSRQSLRSLDGLFHDVSLTSYGRGSLPRIAWTRLNRHYRPAVDLALLILSSSSIEAIHGGRRANSLLIDMNDVFEDFVVTALREALGLDPAQLVQQGAGIGLFLDQAARVRLRPDLSWWENGRCCFVGDVKYKRLKVAGFLHPDLYQLHAYATATRLPAGLLIYAAGETEEAEHVVALAEAWDSGASTWTSTQRDRFADWQVNLTAVSSSSNQAKSDKDAAEWAPTRTASRCAFAEVTVTTKFRWALSIDLAEKDALASMLQGCTATTSNPPPVPTTTTTTTRPPTTTTTTKPPSGCKTAGVYLAKNGVCVANYEDATGDVDCGQLPAVMKPVKVINPSNDPYNLDGDNDGWACET